MLTIIPSIRLSVILNMYVYKSTVGSAHKYTSTGADPGFQGGGGANFKKNLPSGGRRENFWGISSEKS